MINTRSPSFVDEHVGQKIRQMRKQAGLSMMELAERLGMSYQQVQKYEKGMNRVSAGVLYEIACLFGVEINEFFPPVQSAKSSSSEHEELVRDLVDKLEDAGMLMAFKRSIDTISVASKATAGNATAHSQVA